MLTDVPAGASPAGGACPVATVVIAGGGKGDRPVGSPVVQVSGGQTRVWSDPTREASKPTGRSGANQDSLENAAHRTRMVGTWECRVLRQRTKASVAGEGTGRVQPADSPGSMRATCRDGTAAKARNRSWAAEAFGPRHGPAYKPLSGEVAGCLRVGRMGPVKR